MRASLVHPQNVSSFFFYDGIYVQQHTRIVLIWLSMRVVPIR